jgi:nucleoside 2-deoxyribosyltransferase
MTAVAYLAGPDVFLPNAVAHAAMKVEVCRDQVCAVKVGILRLR